MSSKREKETLFWVEKGIISNDQREAILGLYESKPHKKLPILNILASLFIGLALITLIGHNWEQIPVVVRVGGLFAVTFAIHALSIYRLKKFNETNLFFLANLFFGGSIILIAQIYHLGDRAADGIFWWSVGSFCVALCIYNRWVNIESFLLAILWYFLEVSDTYPYFFWLFLAVAFFLLTKEKRPNSFLYTLVFISLALFIPYSYFFWVNGGKIFTHLSLMFLVLPLVLFSLNRLFAIFSSHNPFRNYIGLTDSLTYIPLYLYSFIFLTKSPFYEFYKGAKGDENGFYLFVIILLGLMAILSVISKNRFQYLLTGIFFLLFLPLGVIHNRELLFVFSNVVLFAFYGSLLYKGVREHSKQIYYLGVMGFLVFAFIRYMDLIGSYIGAAMIFLICGLLFWLFDGYFKKAQKKWEEGK